MNSTPDNNGKIEDAPIGNTDAETAPDQAAPVATPPPKKPRKGLILPIVVVVLLGLLASSGGVSYWMWAHFNLALSRQNQQITDLNEALSSKASQRALVLVTRQAQAIEALQHTQTRQLRLLEQSIQRSQAQGLRSHRGWVIAEVRYLLRLASYRLVLMRDVQGAGLALSLADQRLARLGAIDLLPVRKSLASEIQSLRNYKAPDKAGILLQLDQVMSRIVLPTPFGMTALAQNKSPSTANPSTLTGWRGFLHTVWQDITDHISIRHYPHEISNLADITTQARTIQSLYLDLQNARISVITASNASYHQALTRAIRTFKSFPSDNGRIQGLLQTLDKLEAIDIAPKLPAIGHALQLLDKLPSRPPIKPGKGSPS